MTAQTLVLNASFEPLRVVSWQRAMTLWCQEKVEILKEHDREVGTPRFRFRLPSVVRLLQYVRQRGRHVVPFTRQNLYIRDGFTCQYCAVRFDEQDLTFDHVVPVSQGGTRGWENLVAACEPCNKRKADRTPEVAGMVLRRRPRRPAALPALKVSVNARKAPAGWLDYLFLNPDVA